MNGLLSTLFTVFVFTIAAQAQPGASESYKVLLDNDEVLVEEYVSYPGSDVCGPGKHSHDAHLSILLTNAKVTLTTAEGEVQEIELPEGATFWSPAETQVVINSGDAAKITRVYLVTPKKKTE